MRHGAALFIVMASITCLAGCSRRDRQSPAPASSSSSSSSTWPLAFSPPASTSALPTSPPVPEPPPKGPRARRGGMDLTFLVTADTHVGFWEKISIPGLPSGVPIDEVHRIAIGAMNSIEGTPLPRGLTGTFGAPRGLLVAGDLTEMGQPHEWARFETIFGLTGKEGWIHFPVYEGAGNHDVGYSNFVEEQIARRHGDRRYSWDWDDVHVVCLGVAPDSADLAWLRQDLAIAGPDVGVVLYFHYPLEGPYSRGNWFGDGDAKEQLDEILSPYRVLGIFNGHFHASGQYRWRGRDAYLVGSAKHSWHSFAVVRVTDDRFTVAAYNYDRQAFWWWHDKPIFGAKGKDSRWFSSTGALVGRPAQGAKAQKDEE